jgi:hypothetical protein
MKSTRTKEIINNAYDSKMSKIYLDTERKQVGLASNHDFLRRKRSWYNGKRSKSSTKVKDLVVSSYTVV